MYLPWFTRRKGRHKTTILFQTWPQLPNFEVGERVKKAGNQPLPPPLPLSSTELLFLKAENKPPHFKTQRENLISTLSCFPLSVSLLGLMEDFWEMKKCHLPQSQSAGFFFFFFCNDKVERGREYVAWPYGINQNFTKRNTLPSAQVGPTLL